MLDDKQKLDIIKQHINSYPNFPKPGILFKDVFSVLLEPKVFSMLRDILVSYARSVHPTVDCIVALDARGFLFGPLIALELQVPFVPIRKRGKLPGQIKSLTYQLEYGEDVLQIQEKSICENQKVLIVDDLLATGGSLKAAYDLVTSINAEVVACLVIMELTELKGRSKIPCQTLSLINY